MFKTTRYLNQIDKHQVWIIKVFTLLLVISIVVSFIRSYQKLTSTSNYQTLKLKFNKSQWRNPKSQTPIDDATLYHYASFYLVKGGGPFVVNPEVPPWGKYFYGLSILIFGNPYWMSLLSYFGSILLVIFIVKQLTQNKVLGLAAGLWISIEPLITDQLNQVMLDLPLTLFLLSHILINLVILRQHQQNQQPNWLLVGLSGVTLGLFAGTKFPLFAPLVVAADTYLFLNFRKYRQLLLIFTIGGLTYITGYARFIWLHPNPIALAKNIAWTVHFYQISKLPLTPFQWLSAVFFKKYYSPSHQHYVLPDHWNLSWPIIIIGFFMGLGYQVFKQIKSRKQDVYLNYILILTLLLLLTLSFVNFWERYLVLVLPLMVISLVVALNLLFKRKNLI